MALWRYGVVAKLLHHNTTTPQRHNANKSMHSFIAVFIGGGLGSMCRYGIAKILQPFEFVFPWATFLANIISCIVLGALIGWFLKNSAQDSFKLLWLTGFCGGFSTFSTFTYETYALLQDGNYFYAFTNICFSIFVCLISIWLGLRLVQ